MSKGIEPLEMCTKCSLASTRLLLVLVPFFQHFPFIALRAQVSRFVPRCQGQFGLSVARALKLFRLLDGTTKAFCYGGGALISWQKAQKSFRTTPQKPNSLKRSAQATVPPSPPLHTYSNSGRANTTMNNRTISTLHGSPQRERETEREGGEWQRERERAKNTNSDTKPRRAEPEPSAEKASKKKLGHLRVLA